MKKICKVEGCNNNCHGNGYCLRHYLQVRTSGKILKRTIFDKNEIIDCKDYVEIVLYSGRKEQKEVSRTKIDKMDLEKVKKYKWYLRPDGYVSNTKEKIELHQLILGKKKDFNIDHKNHDKKDNRRQNLRHATRSQNMMNQKEVKGIHYRKDTKKWAARIMVNYKYISLGCFMRKDDVLIAREEGEKKYFGEFSYNN